MKTIGFIGAGRMAQALAKGIVTQGMLPPQQLRFCDPSDTAATSFQELIAGSQRSASVGDVVAACDTTWLAVKPQYVSDVFAELQRESIATLHEKLFVSVMAGVTCQRLCEGLKTTRVIRVMPNTPCLIGQGASAFAPASGATIDDQDYVQRLLECVGYAVPLDESLLDAVTGLSGSGPAFVFEFIEGLRDGGVAGGLPTNVAQQLAARTVFGAAAMLLELQTHPAVLKDQVTSPGGTTIAGLRALQRAGVRSGVMDAVMAATKRSGELGQL